MTVSLPMTPAGRARAAHPIPVGTALITIAVLVAEAAFFRARFTTDHLLDADLVWAQPMVSMRYAMPIVACTCVGIALFASRQLGVLVRRVARTAPPARPRALSVLAHVVALATFFVVSTLVLGPHVERIPASWLLALVWVASGAAVVLSAIDWVWPVRAILHVLWVLRVRLAAGAAVGIAVYALIGAPLLTHMPFADEVGRATLRLAEGFLAVVVPTAKVEFAFDPPLIVSDHPEWWIKFADECSGYEGIVLFVALFATFLIAARRRLRFPAVLWLLPIGALAIWVLAAVRTTILYAIGYYGSPVAAIEGFHAAGGWLFLALVALGCVAIATRSVLFSRPVHVTSGGSVAEARPSPAPYVAPLVAATAALMLGRAASLPENLETLERLFQFAAVAGVGWLFRDTYVAVLRRVSWQALAIGVLGAVAWVLLQPAAAEESRWLRVMESGEGLALVPAIVVTAIGYLVVAPLVEELAFRGYLLRRLTSPRFEDVDPRHATIVAFAVSSVLFGGLHSAWLAGTACGALYAFAYARKGRLLDAVVAHAATNLALLLAAAVTGNWHWAG